jgi:hypothetical protein
MTTLTQGKPMTLTADLNAMTEGVRQQVPAEVFSAMEAATAKLATTNLEAQDGTILNTFVNLDYRDRLDPETAIIWLQQAQKS